MHGAIHGPEAKRGESGHGDADVASAYHNEEVEAHW